MGYREQEGVFPKPKCQQCLLLLFGAVHSNRQHSNKITGKNLIGIGCSEELKREGQQPLHQKNVSEKAKGRKERQLPITAGIGEDLNIRLNDSKAKGPSGNRATSNLCFNAATAAGSHLSTIALILSCSTNGSNGQVCKKCDSGA